MKILDVIVGITGLANAMLYLIFGTWYHAAAFGFCAGWLAYLYMQQKSSIRFRRIIARGNDEVCLLIVNFIKGVKRVVALDFF